VQGLRSEPESRQQFVSADRKSTAPAFQAREHSIPSPDANDALRKFNRDTRRVAAGLLGILILAALIFVVLFPERHAMTAGLSERASQPTSDSSRNEDAATRFRSTDLNAGISTSAVTWVTLPLGEQRSSESSSKESLGRTGFSGGSAPSLVLALSPEINHRSALVNRRDWSPAHQPNSVRAIRGKTRYARYRIAGHLGDAEAKKRLLELWHRTRHLSSAFTRASSNVFYEFVRPNQFWPAH
jgi:hypothetical protein